MTPLLFALLALAASASGSTVPGTVLHDALDPYARPRTP